MAHEQGGRVASSRLALQESAVPDLAVELFPASARETVAEIWRELEGRFGNGGLVSSWDWTDTWLNHYGDRVTHWFAVGMNKGEPCGIALVTRGCWWPPARHGMGAIFLGTAGEPRGESVAVEYNRLLVAPEYRDAFARALLSRVRRHAYLTLRLEGFAPDDVDCLLRADRSFRVERHPCPTFDLASTRAAGQSVLDALKSTTRRRIRQSMRLLGDLQVDWAASPEEALSILDELIVLHQQRWQASGKPGAFASDRFAAFHRELVPRLFARSAVALVRVRNPEGTVGCIYAFIERGSVLFYQSGNVQFSDNRIRAGLVVHVACMQECLERGYDVYNFLAGEHRYKWELSTTQREVVSAVAHRFRGTTVVVRSAERSQLPERFRQFKRWRESRAMAHVGNATLHGGSPHE